MSITRLTVFIGIMCAAWMASPLTANAVEFRNFVGLSDKGSTRVKKCAVDGRAHTATYSSGAALNVGLNMDLADGDGLDGDDSFDAVLWFGAPDTPLFSGAWSKINERNGVVTYQLTPSGDLTTISTNADDVRGLPFDSDATGWEKLLGYMNEQAGCACDQIDPPCEDYPTLIFPALSDLVRATLVVNTNVEGQIACPALEGLCSRATVRLEVKSFMDDGADGWGSPKTDSVQFKYEAKGYVVWSGSAATPTPTATATATPTPTPTPTAAP